MKAIRILICTLVLLTLLAQCALCTQVWTEQKISTSNVGTRGGPHVWGDKVYWGDRRNGKAEVYVWDRAGGERLLLTGAGNTSVLAVYEDKLVISRGDLAELRLYDPVSGEQTISTSLSTARNASLYGTTVVYEDNRTGVSQVHMWDPVGGDRVLSPTSYDQYAPKIWGDTVVWEDHRNSTIDTYMYDPRDGVKLLGQNKRVPAIQGDTVVMFRPYDSTYSQMSYMYRYSLSEKRTIRTVTVSGRYIESSALYGDVAVYGTFWDTRDVCAWDPIDGTTRVNQSHFGSAYMPSVYGRYVAWTDTSSIYLNTLVPEPSSLICLALGLAGVVSGALGRKRQRQ